jgi:F-type H+-transporting ATPase subunit a
MSQYLRRLTVTILFLLAINPSVLAAEASEGSDDGALDVVGKALNHDYLELPGTKIYLPRILLVDGDWYFFANTNSAVESGQFVRSEEGGLLRSDGVQ